LKCDALPQSERNRGQAMNGSDISLRSLVDKWLAPTLSMPAHVAQFGRVPATHSRYVRIDGRAASGPLTIVFFKHGDGSWSVLPPLRATLTMSPSRVAH